MSSEPRVQDYSRCWVAYLDILGYRKLVENTAKGDDAEREVGNTSHRPCGGHSRGPSESRGSEADEYGIGWGQRFRVFSDSICLSLPGSDGEFTFSLRCYRSQSAQLAQEGIFVRGAVVRVATMTTVSCYSARHDPRLRPGA